MELAFSQNSRSKKKEMESWAECVERTGSAASAHPEPKVRTLPGDLAAAGTRQLSPGLKPADSKDGVQRREQRPPGKATQLAGAPPEQR